MKERPIILKAHDVRAILEGRKTQNRVVVKPQPYVDAMGNACWNGLIFGQSAYGIPHIQRLASPYPCSRTKRVFCPYGKPGDRLWVREGWSDQHPLAIQEGRYSQAGRAGIPGPPPVNFRTIYRADGEPLQIWRNADRSHPYFTLGGPATEIDANYPAMSSNFNRGGNGIYWHPSNHMPRWASRITLEVTGVRVERLQDISEADALAEGIDYDPGEGGFFHVNGLSGCCSDSAVDAYRKLFEQINASNRPKLPERTSSRRYARVKAWLDKHPDTASWAANPWVWVIEFTRVQGGAE